MFAPLLKLVPALGWSTFSVSTVDASREQRSIDACISAVQIYFSCDLIAPINHTCLCEQFTWHTACYDNHASSPPSYPLYAIAQADMHSQCRAAGSLGAATIQRRYHQQRRQINSILSSVGNVAASFLSAQSLSIAIPTAVPSIPGVPTTSTTPAAEASTTASAVSDSNSTPRTFSTSSSLTPSPSSQSSSTSTSSSSTSSNKSSSPSPGLIAGAVIGSIALLILLGILIMLILRHKRRNHTQKHNSSPPTYASPSLEHGSASARSLDETLVDRTPMAERRDLASTHMGGGMRMGGGLASGNEKEVYRASEPEVSMPIESEMQTSANVWELDGRETGRDRVSSRETAVQRSELESPISPLTGEEGRRFDDWPLPRYDGGGGMGGVHGRPMQRGEHSELHF
ncbi:hypothetical protein FB567DRAFT_90776 [Paraphoma chrysanthemicola]|uniref:Extracellular membrane protein CFEM domain-containing protein n=1 Tax=Paraphoma chrysanthemicola TaxID=798071 RepID=A0A8K0R2R8_9PLEO|nr:hypothetical protein FB567DRAFT_90776 [Paraphoma chrysanthemicola]